jgi:hypothetical protein
MPSPTPFRITILILLCAEIVPQANAKGQKKGPQECHHSDRGSNSGLAQDSAKLLPAANFAIADAIAFAERMMREIDRTFPMR